LDCIAIDRWKVELNFLNGSVACRSQETWQGVARDHLVVHAGLFAAVWFSFAAMPRTIEGNTHKALTMGEKASRRHAHTGEVRSTHAEATPNINRTPTSDASRLPLVKGSFRKARIHNPTDPQIPAAQ
jgi:hypothetical protein